MDFIDLLRNINEYHQIQQKEILAHLPPNPKVTEQILAAILANRRPTPGTYANEVAASVATILKEKGVAFDDLSAHDPKNALSAYGTKIQEVLEQRSSFFRRAFIALRYMAGTHEETRQGGGQDGCQILAFGFGIAKKTYPMSFSAISRGTEFPNTNLRELANGKTAARTKHIQTLLEFFKDTLPDIKEIYDVWIQNPLAAEAQLYQRTEKFIESSKLSVAAAFIPNPDDVAFGLRVKAIRMELGLSNGDLAKLIGYTVKPRDDGRSAHGSMSLIESGQLSIHAEKKSALFALLKVQDDSEFTNLGDKILELQKLRSEHFPEALRKLVMPHRNPDETLEALQQRFSLPVGIIMHNGKSCSPEMIQSTIENLIKKELITSEAALYESFPNAEKISKIINDVSEWRSKLPTDITAHRALRFFDLVM